MWTRIDSNYIGKMNDDDLTFLSKKIWKKMFPKQDIGTVTFS
jgi:hypothetical protein